MMIAVTIKMPRGWNGPHDPHNKVVGPCMFSENCTDSTGEHHTTVVWEQEEVDEIRDTYGHITRIEYILE
jgi:hypothetical protein